MENKKIAIICGFLIAIAVLINIVSSLEYVNFCLGDGESINITPSTYSSKSTDGRLICGSGKCTANLKSGSGFVSICVQKVSDGLYYPPTLPSRCSGGCQSTNGGSTPELTLETKWPFADGGIFTKQSFFLDITTNQIASITLTDNIAGIQKSLCPNCKEVKKTATFKEGLNDITIRAVRGFMIKEKRITFFIDNKKPVISKTLPASNKYASSWFTVFYDEANLKEVKLKYGNNSTGMREAILQNCASGKKQNCSIDIDLKDYDGKQIVYWFEIKDIANSVAIGRQIKIYVDETLPVITLFSHNLGRGYVNFNMSVVEKNFFKIEYMDNSELVPRWKTVCSSLKNGNCFKKLYFRAGEHDLDIRVSDKAGNQAFENYNFVI